MQANRTKQDHPHQPHRDNPHPKRKTNYPFSEDQIPTGKNFPDLSPDWEPELEPTTLPEVTAQQYLGYRKYEAYVQRKVHIDEYLQFEAYEQQAPQQEFIYKPQEAYINSNGAPQDLECINLQREKRHKITCEQYGPPRTPHRATASGFIPSAVESRFAIQRAKNIKAAKAQEAKAQEPSATAKQTKAEQAHIRHKTSCQRRPRYPNISPRQESLYSQPLS